MVDGNGTGECRRLWRCAMVVVLALPLGLLGCGGRTAVSGNVKSNGKPVDGGSLVFSPVGGSGKAATADVQTDGSFKLGTDKPGDGAVPGRYRVTYTPPQVEPSTDPKKNPPPPKWMGLQPKEEEVDVKGGTSLEIELVFKK